MPRLNSRGVATLGYLSTWYDEERYIDTSKRHTGDLRVVLSDGTELHGPLEGGPFYAGASKWVAAVPGGVLWEGNLIPDAGLADYCDPIGPDGSLVVKRLRNSFGPWGFVGGADFGGDCRAVTNYGNGQACWIEGDWVLRANWGCRYIGTRCYSYRLKGDDFLFQSADTGELVYNGKVIGKQNPAPPFINYFRPDFMREPDGRSYIVWSTVEGEPSFEFLRISDVALGRKADWKAGPVTPTPPPAPPIEVPPVSEPKLDIDGKPIIERIRGSYQIWNDVSNAHFLLEVQKAFPGSKLYKKPTGENVRLPDGTLVSRDLLIIEPFYIDVLGDAENTGTPAWSVHYPAEHPENFYVPTGGTTPIPVPVPVPQPAPGLSRDEVAKMIQEAVDSLAKELSGGFHDIADAIDVLEQGVAEAHQLRLDFNKVMDRLTQEITTSRAFGHSHKVTILK